MLYLKDIVIFGEASNSNVHCMLNIIESFRKTPGQRITYGKSHIIALDSLPTDLEQFLFNQKEFRRESLDILGFPYIHNARHTRKMNTALKSSHPEWIHGALYLLFKPED